VESGSKLHPGSDPLIGPWEGESEPGLEVIVKIQSKRGEIRLASVILTDFSDAPFTPWREQQFRRILFGSERGSGAGPCGRVS